MPVETARPRLRRRLVQRLEELRAFLVIARRYSSEQRWHWEKMASAVDRLKRKEAKDLLDYVDKAVRELERELRPTKPRTFYTSFVDRAALDEGDLLFLPKWWLRRAFDAFDGAFPELVHLPEHALVSFDVLGTYSRAEHGEYRILEASLFEDMAALFNRAWDLSQKAQKRSASKKLLKECAALRRASVLAAFNLIEAYINSIAFDYLATHAPGEIEPRVLELLAERDHTGDRERLVSFRTKLLQYPKIAIGAEHPPIQEHNCAELQFLLTESKLFRDAIVHANPRPDFESFRSEKELLFWYLANPTPMKLDDATKEGLPIGGEPDALWTRTIDTTIALVRRIEQTVHGHHQRLFWVHDRGTDGRFPAEAFD